MVFVYCVTLETIIPSYSLWTHLMGEEEDMEEGEVVTEEEVDTLGEEVVMEEEGEVEVDMVEEEVVVMEEEEAVMEEGVVTVGEEVLVEEVLVEEVVTSKDHKASPHRALDSRQVQRWVYVSSLYVKFTICHYTPFLLPHPFFYHTLTPSPLTAPSPPHTSPLTGTRREAPVTDACDLSPDSVSS